MWTLEDALDTPVQALAAVIPETGVVRHLARERGTELAQALGQMHPPLAALGEGEWSPLRRPSSIPFDPYCDGGRLPVDGEDDILALDGVPESRRLVADVSGDEDLTLGLRSD